MSNPKLSIVVPVYNSEVYLQECLESIQGQEFRDFEVLCVDDASTDKSVEILDGYAKRDGRFRVLTQLHGGPGVARNHGMAEASGDYLYFMDSDDFLSGKDALSLMVEEMERYRPDILFVGANLRFESEGLRQARYREMQRYRQGTVYGSFDRGEELFRAMVTGGGFLCNTFFQCARRAFLEGIQASFPATDFYEDEVYTFRALLQAGKVRHTGLRPYVRRVREESITTRKPVFRAVWEGILGWRSMMDFLAEHALSEPVREVAMLHLARRGQDLIRKYRELPEAEQEKRQSLSEGERSLFGMVMNLQPVFRRQMASYLFPYHLFPRGAKVVLYGAGNVGREFYLQALGSGYVECTGLLDKQAKERRVDALPVHLPEDIRSMEYDAVLIAVQDGKLAESVRRDLHALGVPDEKIAWDGMHYLKQDFYEGYYFPLLDRMREEGKDG